jgi:hypothetical protein
MPIQLPVLANKSFGDLMNEMMASIPKYSRDWTNFNPSDPGITILELLAWIAETLIYRADRIPEETLRNFVRLVTGSEVRPHDPTDKAHNRIVECLNQLESGGTADWENVKTEVQRFLNSRYRAVIPEDFTELAKEACPSVIKRAEVFVTNDETVDIVIIPEDQYVQKMDQNARNDLIRVVTDYLKPRKLIGTPVTVRMADYTTVSLKLTLICENYLVLQPDPVTKAVKSSVARNLNSITGGPKGAGWPYGRTLTVYDLFSVIEKVEGVRHVEEICVWAAEAEMWKPLTRLETNGLILLTGQDIIVKKEEEIHE